MNARAFAALPLLLAACSKPATTPVAGAPPPSLTTPPELTVKAFPLPAGSGPVSIDYIVCDRKNGTVWVPSARDAGAVDVFDIAKGTFSHLDGFKTEVKESEGRKRAQGPNAAAIGDGVVYVGNRATREICAFDAVTRKRGACLVLPTSTDGIQLVASVKELWITAPRERALVVLDATKPDALAPKQTIDVGGQSEGFAVDEAHGVFYTNLEDKNRTLAIDVKTHTVKASWATGCSDDGPRGLAFDPATRLLAVACTDHVQVLDAGRDGAMLGRFDTGTGLDNLDYVESKRWLYMASGKPGRLSVARLEPNGQLVPIGTAATAERARNAVADANGNAYVVDPAGPRLLTFSAPP